MPSARRFAALWLLGCLSAACAFRSDRPAPPTIDAPQRSPVPAASVPSPVTPDPAPDPAEAKPRDVDPDECSLVAPTGESITTVALSDGIDRSRAPRPANESERLLFRQLYETLVKADCLGRVEPGLAASWRLDADGRTWIVTLRDDAQFSDGSAVTAADIHASWLGDAKSGTLHPDVRRLVDSIVPIADRTLAIRLHSRRTDMPLPLAHADLAVAKAVPTSPWPLGTRAARIVPDETSRPPTVTAAFILVRDTLPAIRFLVGGGDPRDLLDYGVDLLVTHEPATLAYAATLGPFESMPLAWQRTYVLLTPGRSHPLPALPEGARQALAADAVRGEARGATGPFWWQGREGCPASGGSPLPAMSRAPVARIVYDASDQVARDLAERFVGLAHAPDVGPDRVLDAIFPDRPRRTVQRSSGLAATALTIALRRGADTAYVMSLDRQPSDPCRDLRVLLDQAPWLDVETILPLVDARRHAVVRRGRSGLTVEWDGGLLVDGAVRR